MKPNNTYLYRGIQCGPINKKKQVRRREANERKTHTHNERNNYTKIAKCIEIATIFPSASSVYFGRICCCYSQAKWQCCLRKNNPFFLLFVSKLKNAIISTQFVYSIFCWRKKYSYHLLPYSILPMACSILLRFFLLQLNSLIVGKHDSFSGISYRYIHILSRSSFGFDGEKLKSREAFRFTLIALIKASLIFLFGIFFVLLSILCTCYSTCTIKLYCVSHISHPIRMSPTRHISRK